MELGGVVMACGPVMPVVCIRGISDIVGFERDEAWTGYACHAAASFLAELIRSGELDGLLSARRGEPAPPNAGSDNPFAAQLIDRFNIRAKAITHCLGEIEIVLPRYAREVNRFRSRFLELHQGVIAALEKSPLNLLQMDDLIREINKLSIGVADRPWFQYATFEYNRGALMYDSLLGVFLYTGLGMYTGRANFELSLNGGKINGYTASSAEGRRAVGGGTECDIPFDPFSCGSKEKAIDRVD